MCSNCILGISIIAAVSRNYDCERAVEPRVVNIGTNSRLVRIK